MTLLSNIHTPMDLRLCAPEKLPQLALEIRAFMQSFRGVKKGHLDAGLGVVELSIALHYVFDTPRDSIIWDVGHQCYAHKILTGRRDDFYSIRNYGGISGFPMRSESSYDDFGTGHSSTSISAALGMAVASKLAGDFSTRHIAVIGDASIASGMALEALNHATETGANLLVVLNDNGTGIDPTIGAFKKHFEGLKKSPTPSKNIAHIFCFDYTGVVCGHHLPTLIHTLQNLKSKGGLQFLHIKTEKGKGAIPHQKNFLKSDTPLKFQDILEKTLLDLACKNEKILAVTPAMTKGSGLSAMRENFPDRTFDVGIAEQHAVSFSAGLAIKGMLPFCVVYSTFLQRGYDQLLHDVCLQSLPVIFCVDRAGLVGEDGATHHGVFDIAFLRTIPNLIIVSVLDGETFRNILYTAQKTPLKKPIAIRYPRGGNISKSLFLQPPKIISIGKSRVLKTALISLLFL